jgi:hypothetical protein
VVAFVLLDCYGDAAILVDRLRGIEAVMFA